MKTFGDNNSDIYIQLIIFMEKEENIGEQHLFSFFFSSPQHEVSYGNHSPSVSVRRPSVYRPSVACSHFLVYTLASTNINQSPPNLVKIYMTMRSQMSSIMDVIGPEYLEFLTLELKKNAIFHFVYILASTIIKQSSPNLVKINVTIRSRMSSILGLIGVICP